MSEHVFEHLSAYLDGALSAAERERFRAHLAECPACSKRLLELAAVDAGLRDLPVSAPEGYFEGLPSRVRSRLSASARPRRRLLRAPVWTLAAAAALLVGVLAPLTLREKPRTPDPASARSSDQATASAAYETDQLARPSRPAPPPTVALPPAPAVSAAPAEDFRTRAEPKAGALGKAKAETALSRPEESAVAPAAPAPPPRSAAAAPAAGFAEPPRANQQVEPRRQAPMKQSADAQPLPSEGEGRVTARRGDTKDAGEADRTFAKSDAPESRERAAGLAASPRAVAESAAYRDLLARAPRDAADARSLRESWRRLSSETADLLEADEARVRVIEMGLLAWRFERRAEDRTLAERDAAAYLARKDARQPARVRSAVADLSR